MPRVGLTALLCALFLGGPASVWAEVWGWVDERGVPHFASHQVDGRYQLFFKGTAPELLVKPLPAPAAAAAAPARPLPEVVAAPAAGVSLSTAASPRPRLLGLLENSPGYKRVLPLVQDTARQLGLDVHLMVALIAAESAFDHRAVSPKGAVGLMQLMPGTAERYGVRPEEGSSLRERLMHPQTNLRAGALFLRDLLLLFPGRIDLVLAAYNAGPGAVRRAGLRIPDYPETQNYVRTVTELLGYLRPGYYALSAEPVNQVAAPAPAPVVLAPPPPPAPTTWLTPQAAGAVARGILLAPPGIPLDLSPVRD
jgi:soluble lytic murein transglycosylase-like protein